MDKNGIFLKLVHRFSFDCVFGYALNMAESNVYRRMVIIGSFLQSAVTKDFIVLYFIHSLSIFIMSNYNIDVVYYGDNKEKCYCYINIDNNDNIKDY